MLWVADEAKNVYVVGLVFVLSARRKRSEVERINSTFGKFHGGEIDVLEIIFSNKI
mgnify:CR=1 FL=1